jgi:hypothetical protein
MRSSTDSDLLHTHADLCPECGHIVCTTSCECDACNSHKVTTDSGIDLDDLTERIILDEYRAPEWMSRDFHRIVERLRIAEAERDYWQKGSIVDIGTIHELEEQVRDLRAELLDENHPSIWEVVRTSERVQLEAKLAAAEAERDLMRRNWLAACDDLSNAQGQVRSLTAERKHLLEGMVSGIEEEVRLTQENEQLREQLEVLEGKE